MCVATPGQDHCPQHRQQLGRRKSRSCGGGAESASVLKAMPVGFPDGPDTSGSELGVQCDGPQAFASALGGASAGVALGSQVGDPPQLEKAEDKARKAGSQPELQVKDSRGDTGPPHPRTWDEAPPLGPSCGRAFPGDPEAHSDSNMCPQGAGLGFRHRSKYGGGGGGALSSRRWTRRGRDLSSLLCLRDSFSPSHGRVHASRVT